MGLRSNIKIVNVVATADLKQKINVEKFNKFDNLSCDYKLYQCGYVKDAKMIGRVTIFPSGKIISVGTKSPEQSKKELRKAVNILAGFKLIKSVRLTPKINNIVAVITLPKKVHLEKLAKILPRAIYEPDVFAGIIYPIIKNITTLIFASGKIVCAGSKTIDDLNSASFELTKRIEKTN